MKKLITSLLIALTLVQFGSVLSVFADEEEKPALTAEEERELSDMQMNISINNSIKEKNNTRIKEIESELKNTTDEKKRKALSDELQILEGSNRDLDSANERSEDTQVFKVKKLLEDFDKKITTTSEKGEKEVGKYKTADGSLKDCTSDDQHIDCFNYALHKRANTEYVEFLKKQRDHQLCRARLSDPARVEECTEAKKALDAAANKVRGTVSEIAQKEQDRNKEAQFNVSKIFSLNEEGETNRSILEVASQLADWMILLVSSLAVTALIIGGFMMIISGGDETRLEEGKTIFTYSLIGLAVTLLAYGIVSIIQGLFYS